MSQQKTYNVARAAMISVVILGLATLAASAFLVSSFFAILGFSLIFWGAILLYIAPAKNVFLDLLNAAIEPSSANIERILTEYNITQKGIYLPAESNEGLLSGMTPVTNSESVLIFFPETPNSSSKKPYRPKNSERGGLYLTPPGQALCKLFEQRIGRSFLRMDFLQFKKILPFVLTKDLRLAEKVDIKTEKSVITITVTNSILDHVSHETTLQTKTHKQVGCLLTSAMACALTQVVGKPITVQNEMCDAETKTTQIRYQVTEDAKD